MPKSRVRKQPRATQKNPREPQPQLRQLGLWRRWAGARRRTRILIGTFAGLSTIAVALSTVYFQATLRVLPPSPSLDPFYSPFAIHNFSSYIPATDAKFICSIVKISLPGIIMNNSRFSGVNLNFDRIERNGIANIRCGINGLGPNVEATIDIEGSYKTVGIKRILGPVRFSWLGKAYPPAWIEGDLR